MKLRKVAELPPQSRTSIYDEVIEQVKADPEGLYVLDTDVKNLSQLAQELKKRFGVQANVRNGELFLKAKK